VRRTQRTLRRLAGGDVRDGAEGRRARARQGEPRQAGAGPLPARASLRGTSAVPAGARGVEGAEVGAARQPGAGLPLEGDGRGGAVSLRTRLALAACALVAEVVAGLSVFVLWGEHGYLVAQAGSQQVSMLRSLARVAREAELSKDDLVLLDYVRSLPEDHPA